MIVSINYADQKFRKKQRLSSWTAKHIGRVDRIISYSPDDIDLEFYEANREILSQSRGGGAWLWKPYVVQKCLSELNSGDYLIYVDSGALYLKNIESLFEQFDKVGQDIMLFDLPLLEIQWTSKEVLDYFAIKDSEELFSNQIMGSIICFKKSNRSIEFVDEWLEACKNKDLLLPPSNIQSQYKNFLAHREDQSVLSALAKKQNILRFSDPTDYGAFPFKYINRNRFFYLNSYSDGRLILKTFFLHVRNSNPLIYLFKYVIKCLINKIGLGK